MTWYVHIWRKELALEVWHLATILSFKTLRVYELQELLGLRQHVEFLLGKLIQKRRDTPESLADKPRCIDCVLPEHSSSEILTAVRDDCLDFAEGD